MSFLWYGINEVNTRQLSILRSVVNYLPKVLNHPAPDPATSTAAFTSHSLRPSTTTIPTAKMSASTTALRALSGYRRLFRARSKLFAGDTRALRESAVAIRAEFDKNRQIAGPHEHIEGLLTMIDEAEDMLLHGIVRGELNTERNVVEVKIDPEHESRMDSETLTHVDPITAETGKQMDGDGTPKVEITKSSGSDSKSNP